MTRAYWQSPVSSTCGSRGAAHDEEGSARSNGDSASERKLHQPTLAALRLRRQPRTRVIARHPPHSDVLPHRALASTGCYESRVPRKPKTADPETVARIGKMLAHPYRVQILRAALADGELAPVDFADASGITLGNVSFHCRTLEKLDGLELVRTEPRRGALKHIYRVPSKVAAQLRAVLDVLA